MNLSEPRPGSGSGALILIVEDSATQAMQLQWILEQAGYEVATAANGSKALGALGKRIPTMVITDVNMPEMDGYELCKRIKDEDRLRHVPVILLTSLSDPKDILKGLECGADNFIVKPYDQEFLLSRIKHVLANLELRRQANGHGTTEIFYAGHKYKLTADRPHSIDLLLSTYETAVQKNLELSRAKEQLEVQAGELREKNTQMRDDLEMARELQTAFLPRNYPVFPPTASPEQSAIQFCHRYSTTTELGGDFFEIMAVSDTEAAVFICDVMGHGVRAALVAAVVRGLVEELKSVAQDPGEFLTAMNQSLCSILKETATPIFATAFYVVADLGRGELRYANAGHPPAFHAQRAPDALNALGAGVKPGPALGIFEPFVYATGRAPLSSSDMVMLFTDGLYEIECADGQFFTKEQLRANVERRLAMPAPQLFDGLLAEIKGFSRLEEFDDDMCIVGLEVGRLMNGKNGHSGVG